MADEEFTEKQKVALQHAVTADPDQRFALECNQIFMQIEETYGDAEGVVERLTKTGVNRDDVLKDIQTCNNPAKAYYELSQDEEKAKAVRDAKGVHRARMLAAIEDGQPMPTFNPRPAWKQSRTDLSNPNIDDKSWGRLWDRKYLGKGS
jgi:hypothetical protein